eukprot:TRINITY_DN5709_c3_g2_i1.p1 TRINITY_DN5709_c3_g2~~TRINITY_DN5709_c3_g2_i1.p1  ORF type:complete len:469 (+),score=58.83 TRINITY_DN5709_c3_g2_i1:45-1409(+)
MPTSASAALSLLLRSTRCRPRQGLCQGALASTSAARLSSKRRQNPAAVSPLSKRFGTSAPLCALAARAPASDGRLAHVLAARSAMAGAAHQFASASLAHADPVADKADTTFASIARRREGAGAAGSDAHEIDVRSNAKAPSGSAASRRSKRWRSPAVGGVVPARFEHVPKSTPACATAASGAPARDGDQADECASIPANAVPGVLLADVRYDVTQRILLVGEAGFSFAAALATQLGDCSNMTATSFESQEELLTRYGSQLLVRIAALEERLCGIHHSLGAADLASRFREASFDRVVFNFPLCGRVSVSVPNADPAKRETSHGERARRSYADLTSLLDAFFFNAARVLRPGGECHVRLTDQYATSRGLHAAQKHGLHLAARVDFSIAFEQVYKHLGYSPVAVSGGGNRGRGGSGKVRGRPQPFDVQNSSTFVFQRAHGRLHQNMDGEVLASHSAE